MRRIAVGILLTLSTSVVWADPPAAAPKEPAIRVECHGKLRMEDVAIGGETTGAKISFNGMKWELKMIDDASRAFAKQHHKKPVTVIGTLRQVRGTEIPVRWIVDVQKLSPRDDAALPEGAGINMVGMLRKQDAAANEPARMAIEADGITWPLESSTDAAMKTKLETMIGKSVMLTGRLMNRAAAKDPPQPIVAVSQLDVPSEK